MRKEKTFNDRDPICDPYVVGKWYDGKGVYLGENKKGHMFQKHGSVNRRVFGPKYHFEQL